MVGNRPDESRSGLEAVGFGKGGWRLQKMKKKLFRDEERPFIEHLEELRMMLIKMGITLMVAMIGCFVGVKPLLEILYRPLRWAQLDPAQFLKVLGVADPFTMSLQVAFFAGLIVSLPLCLYFVAGFVLPALTPIERRMIGPVFVVGTGLFVGGVLFCYYIIAPQALRFFFDFATDLGFTSEWTVQNYISFLVQLLLGFGLAFELPLVVLALAKLGLVDARWLRVHRRHAIVAMVVFAAAITPTSDLFTLGLMFLPMWALYEICIGICWMIERGNAAEA
jgi:sec-independent protein translocase protein TatC